MTTIPLGPALLAGSSDLPGGFGRAVLFTTHSRARCWAPPYLVLLRAGFCLPPALQPARCALTAPFHPYPPSSRLASRAKAGGMFSVPLSFELPRPGVTRRTALWSSDFPRQPQSGCRGRLVRCGGKLSLPVPVRSSRAVQPERRFDSRFVRFHRFGWSVPRLPNQANRTNLKNRLRYPSFPA